MNKHNASAGSPNTSAPQETATGLFPHYTRLFPARLFRPALILGGKIMLWSVLIAGIGINITLLHRTGEGAPVWTTILSRATNILGAADAVDNSKRDDSGTANDGYLYWAEVTNAHPDYRDAHVNAAIYAYRLGLHEKVLLHVRKVEALDPNYSGLSDLKDLLGEN